MIYCVWVYVGTDDSGFKIIAANGLDMIVARFVASMMMHINCEKDIRNGINMMKYSVNHYEKFTNVYATFFIAWLSTAIAFITEINVMLILSSLPNILGVVMKYVSLAAISKIPGFYYESLIEHKLLEAGGMKMKISNYRKDKPLKDAPLCIHIIRAIYKNIRMFYAGFSFYFMPFMGIFLNA